MMKNRLFFIGFGNMAEAIHQRLDKKLFENVFLIEKSDDRRNHINKKNLTNTQILKQLGETKFSSLDILMLAVKPNQIATACKEIDPLILGKKDIPIIISIAAGIKISSIRNNFSRFQEEINIFRAMPNLCAKGGDSVTGLYGEFANDKDSNSTNVISKIFTSVGKILWVKKESDLHIVTAISGSGPAYIFYIMQAMIETAKELGLDEESAKMLVTHTVIGSGKIGVSIDNFAEQISKVTSKGGTTEVAMNLFKKKNFNLIFKQAIKAAHSKSKEISNS